MIPYGCQDITEKEIESVVQTLKSDLITQGMKVPEFEQLMCSYVDSSYAVAMNSATSALHCACLALGLSKGDYFWTSPNSFVASSNCALYCGAIVDFVDTEAGTQNMSVSALEEKLKKAEKLGTLPKIVVPVHFGGHSCDMKSIALLSEKYGFRIIEDASHAIGGIYQGKAVGSCEFSDICVFSFHPVKIITTIEGGMALTNSSSLDERLRLLRSHGVTRDSGQMSDASKTEGGWYYEQVGLGFNYRLTDVQAALGICQMARLEGFIARRQDLAEGYNRLLSDLPMSIPLQKTGIRSSYHLYPIRLRISQMTKSREEVFNFLRQNGVGVNVHYIPIHTQPFYRELGFKLGDFPESERYYSEALSLPIHNKLSNEDQEYIVEKLVEICA